MNEVRFLRENCEVRQWTRPCGGTAAMVAVTTTNERFADEFDVAIPGDSNDPDEVERVQRILDSTRSEVFKHKADGTTSFEDFTDDGSDLVILMSDEQYEEVRSYLEHDLTTTDLTYDV